MNQAELDARKQAINGPESESPYWKDLMTSMKAFPSPRFLVWKYPAYAWILGIESKPLLPRLTVPRCVGICKFAPGLAITA